MDPGTILATVNSVLLVTYKVTKGLYSFIEDTRLADFTITGLHNETSSFERALKAFKALLDKPDVMMSTPMDFWQNVHGSLRACGATMSRLSKIIPEEEPSRESSHVFGNTLKIFKLRLNNSDIERLRAQLQSHMASMSLITNSISISISASTLTAANTTPNMVADALKQLNEKMDGLKKQMSDHKDVEEDFQDEDGGLLRLHRGLRDAAVDIASNITEIATRSSRWDGSNIGEDGYIAHIQSVMSEMDLTSEIGERLRPDKLDQIESWNSANRAETRAALETAVPPISNAAPPSLDDGSDLQLAWRPDEFVQSSGYENEDESWDLKLALSEIKDSQREAANGNFQGAEKSLDSALETVQGLPRYYRHRLDLRDHKCDLAMYCLRQDKLDKAQSVCEEVMREPPVTDGDRARQLNAAYVFSQVLTRKGNLDEAKKRVFELLTGLQKMGNTGDEYYRAQCLLAAILSYAGKQTTAETISKDIPPDFRSPGFMPPLSEHTQDSSATNEDTAQVGLPVTQTSTSEHASDSGGARNSSSEQSTSRASESDVQTSTAPSTSAASIVDDENSQGAVDEITSSENDLVMLEDDNEPYDASWLRERPETISLLVSEEEHVAALEALKDNGFRVDKTSFDSGIALLWAVQNGSLPTVKLLCKGWRQLQTGSWSRRSPQSKRLAPASPEAYDQLLGTPLCIAARLGHVDIASVLIDHGAEVDRIIWAQNFSTAFTALYAAVCNDQYAMTRFLLQKGANPAVLVQRRGWTPLVSAAGQGRLRAVRDMIHARPGLINHGDEYGVEALKLAAKNGHVQVMKYLIREGVPVNRKPGTGRSALHWAITNGQVDAVRVLIDHSARHDLADSNYGTPLHHAISAGNPKITQILLDAGASPDDFKLLRNAVKIGAAGCVQILLDKGAAVDGPDENGCTPLFHAAGAGNIATLQVLLDKHAQVNLMNDNGKTPLSQAVKYKHAAAAALLRAYGAEMKGEKYAS